MRTDLIEEATRAKHAQHKALAEQKPHVARAFQLKFDDRHKAMTHDERAEFWRRWSL